MPVVRVVGAGFSGLATAYFLLKAGFRVEIFESTERAGGLIQTDQLPEGIAEAAANAFLNSAELKQMAADIGVSLLPVKAKARARWILRGQKFRRWPLRFLETLGLLCRAPFVFFRSPRTGESVRDWGRRVLGEAATEYLLEPALQGIYAASADRLSASLVFDRFYRRSSLPSSTRRRRKLPSGERGSVSPREGMGHFMQALAAWIRAQDNASLSLGSLVDASQVKTWSEEATVILCVPPAAAATLLNSEPKLATQLAALPTVGLVSATLFFAESERLQSGFGVLIPRSENLRTLGVLFNDGIFENRARTGLCSETWILRTSDLSDSHDEALLDFVIREERSLLSGRPSPAPVARSVRRWERALPLYGPELEKFLKEGALSAVPAKIQLFGNYLGALGLSRILLEASEWPHKLMPQTKSPATLP